MARYVDYPYLDPPYDMLFYNSDCHTDRLTSLWQEHGQPQATPTLLQQATGSTKPYTSLQASGTKKPSYEKPFFALLSLVLGLTALMLLAFL